MKKITLFTYLLVIILVSTISIFIIINKPNKTIKEDITIEKELTGLDKIYNSTSSKNYKDIRNLSSDYNDKDAIKENAFIISGTKVYNNNLYKEFMNNYNNKKEAFLRIVQFTTEGDLILNDIFYDSKENLLYLVTDNTRDNFASTNDKEIKLTNYNNITTWNYKNNTYLVLYNNTIPKQEEDIKNSIDNKDLYIVTTIN